MTIACTIASCLEKNKIQNSIRNVNVKSLYFTHFVSFFVKFVLYLQNALSSNKIKNLLNLNFREINSVFYSQNDFRRYVFLHTIVNLIFNISHYK